MLLEYAYGWIVCSHPHAYIKQGALADVNHNKANNKFVKNSACLKSCFSFLLSCQIKNLQVSPRAVYMPPLILTIKNISFCEFLFFCTIKYFIVGLANSSKSIKYVLRIFVAANSWMCVRLLFVIKRELKYVVTILV